MSLTLLASPEFQAQATAVERRIVRGDLGTEVEIGSGIVADDRVVVNPPDGIAAGDKVRIAGAPGVPGEPETAEAK